MQRRTHGSPFLLCPAHRESVQACSISSASTTRSSWRSAVLADHSVVRAVRRGALYQSGGQGERVADVDGQDITQAEWDAQHRNEVDRIRQQAPNLDAGVARLASGPLRHARAHGARPRAGGGGAKAQHDGVRRATGPRCSREDPGIASFRRPDGKFDRERFMRGDRADARAVRSFGARRPGHAAGAARRGRHCLRAAGAGGSALLDAFYERREVQVARFKPAEFTSKVAAERRRSRGLLQGSTPRSSRRRSRPASNTWCSTWTPSRKTSLSTKPTQELLRAERRAPAAPRKSAAPATS